MTSLECGPIIFLIVNTFVVFISAMIGGGRLVLETSSFYVFSSSLFRVPKISNLLFVGMGSVVFVICFLDINCDDDGELSFEFVFLDSVCVQVDVLLLCIVLCTFLGSFIIVVFALSSMSGVDKGESLWLAGWCLTIFTMGGRQVWIFARSCALGLSQAWSDWISGKGKWLKGEVLWICQSPDSCFISLPLCMVRDLFRILSNQTA